MTGFERCLEPIMKKYGDEKVFYWANLRQEPVVYVNDKPYSARDPKALHQHIMISNPEEVNKMEAEFIEEIQKRGADFKYFQDVFGDIPDDRSAKLEEKPKNLKRPPLCPTFLVLSRKRGMILYLENMLAKLRPFVFHSLKIRLLRNKFLTRSLPSSRTPLPPLPLFSIARLVSAEQPLLW